MSAAEEEARALAFRQQELRRQGAERQRMQQLAGSASQKRTLDDAWKPVRLWLAERRNK